MLPGRSISVILVQAPTKLNNRHLYQLYTNDDLPSDLIPLAVDHKIDYKYPKLQKVPLLNTEHNKVYIPRQVRATGRSRCQSQQHLMDHRWYS